MGNMRILYLVLAVFGLLIPIGAQADHRHNRYGGYVTIYGNGWYFNYGQAPGYQTFYPPPVYYAPQPIIMAPQRQQVTVSCPINMRLGIATDPMTGQRTFVCH